MRRGFLFLAACLVTTSVVRGEVSVVLSRTGDDVSQLRVRTDPEAGVVWSALPGTPPDLALNPLGDGNGDGYPSSGVMALPTNDPVSIRAGSALRRVRPAAAGPSPTFHVPVVVWARSDGADQELVYSLWDLSLHQWRAPAHVDRVDNTVDDYDPHVALLGLNVYVVWSRRTILTPRMAVTGRMVWSGNTYDIQWDPPFVVPPALAAQDPEVAVHTLARELGEGGGTTPTPGGLQLSDQ